MPPAGSLDDCLTLPLLGPSLAKSTQGLPACLNVCLLACCLLLAGCGLQLRGQGAASLALDTVYLDAPAEHSAMLEAFQRALAVAGIDTPRGTAAEAEDRQASVAILEVRSNRHPVATTANLEAAAYQLSLEANIAMTVAGEAEPLSATLLAERVYTLDRASLTGSHEEETTIWQEMRADLARRMIRRLDAAVTRQSSARQSK